MKRAISKVLVELQKEAPDLSYIRGLLEGAVEEEPASLSLPAGNTIYPFGTSLPSATYATSTKSDEQEIIPQSVRVGPVGDLA